MALKTKGGIMKFTYCDKLSEDQREEAERLSNMIKSFHILRVNCILSGKESFNCYERLLKLTSKMGLYFKDIGFYEYEIGLKEHSK